MIPLHVDLHPGHDLHEGPEIGVRHGRRICPQDRRLDHTAKDGRLRVATISVARKHQVVPPHRGLLLTTRRTICIADVTLPRTVVDDTSDTTPPRRERYEHIPGVPNPYNPYVLYDETPIYLDRNVSLEIPAG